MMVVMALFASERHQRKDDAFADPVATEEHDGLSTLGMTVLTVVGLGFLALAATLGAGPVVADDDGTATARPTIFCPLGVTVTD